MHCVSHGHGITECGISGARDCSALTLTFVDDRLAEIGCSFMHSKYKGMVAEIPTVEIRRAEFIEPVDRSKRIRREV